MGLTSLKNKVSRNAFDLSHRHMFTAQIGELLPILCQWVNPNETFKIGFSGMSRTAPLNTAAFTRLRENVQYFFVPFQCLWKYFEQSVNNMNSGQAGQDISMVASSLSTSIPLSTSMPYINYTSLVNVIKLYYNLAVTEVSKYFGTLSKPSLATAQGFYDFVLSDGNNLTDYPDFFNQVFVNGEYRYVAVAKLLNSLGYGNYSFVITHDVFARAFDFCKELPSFNKDSFLGSNYALNFDQSFRNSPNLSIFPLLAYHKIVNDFYRLRNWQSYESWKSNIDYITPDSSYDVASYTDNSLYSDSSIFDLEFSNLPLDYFTGVLPRAQYGDESAVPVNGSSSTSSFTGFKFDPVKFDDPHLSVNVQTNTGRLFPGSSVATPLQSGQISISSDVSSDLKISALRSAVALQKYKEIQNSSDWSFEEQVLAHFGIKPSCDVHKSRFIGGSDSTISINPQINSNFVDGGMPDIKAIGQSQLQCNCEFKSDTYGVIIGIYRCVPQLDFAHIGFDRNLFKTDASDFPIPELDSIGMQTSYRSEVAAPAVGHKAYNAPVDLSATYGFAPRYAELKTSYDRFDGGFNDAYSDWVTGLDTSILDYWYSVDVHNNYVTDVSNLFICRPSLCYPIFLNQWSGTANDDKLLVASVNSVTAVRPFSVHGLPWSN